MLIALIFLILKFYPLSRSFTLLGSNFSFNSRSFLTHSLTQAFISNINKVCGNPAKFERNFQNETIFKQRNADISYVTVKFPLSVSSHLNLKQFFPCSLASKIFSQLNLERNPSLSFCSAFLSGNSHWDWPPFGEVRVR